MNYAEEIRNMKIVSPDGCHISPGGKGTKDIKPCLEKFCTKDDLVGVPVSRFFPLFQEYCEERGFGPFSKIAVGRAVSSVFGLVSKSVNQGGKYYRVYFYKEASDGAGK